MPYSGNVIVTMGMRGRSEFTQPEVTSPDTLTPETTVLHLPTADLLFGIYGTPSELLDFASDITHSVYDWMLTNGHADWLDREDTRYESKVASSGDNGREAGRQSA